MITGIGSTTAESSSARTAIFGIVCSAHFINHFQSAMLGVIYPLMMKELGMGYMAIASLAALFTKAAGDKRGSQRMAMAPQSTTRDKRVVIPI